VDGGLGCLKWGDFFQNNRHLEQAQRSERPSAAKKHHHMSVELLTKADLQQFKHELFQELRSLIAESPNKPKKWLKSYEVRDLLGISPGTLQNMRTSGTLIGSKIGGLMFYDHDEILKLMQSNKTKIRNL
jgi:hypothetical protein